MRKEPTKSGDEVDWCSKWRHIFTYCSRAGVGKNIKRQMNKRCRRRGKREATDEI